MQHNIYRGNTLIDIVKASGSLTKRYMDASTVNISFMADHAIDLQIGDSIIIHNQRFYLNKDAVLTQSGHFRFEYTATFEARFYDLAKVVYCQYDSNNDLAEGSFSIMGTAEVFIDLMVLNANRDQQGWVKGVIDPTITKNLTFSNNTKCLTALAQIAEAFEIEYWVENQTINMTKKGADSGLTFSYGKGNGLYKLTRANENDAAITTVVYARGGNKNIPANYRNYSSRLKLPVANGVRLTQNTNLYGFNEEWLENDEIYPRRIGVVSAVNGALKFSDAAIDFDVNQQLLPGLTAKITFQTGQLAGYDLELSAFNSVTKEFTLNVNTEEKAIKVPSDLIHALVGDTYIISDIVMPLSYITAAEQELYVWALAYLQKNSIPRVSVTPEADKIDFKRKNTILSLGDTAQITANPLGINRKLRILGFTQDINDAYNYTSLEFAETALPQAINRIAARSEKVQTAIKLNDLLNPAKARNNWRTSQELLSMMFDADGYYDGTKIKPESVETLMLQVGARSQQMQLNGVVLQPNYGGNANAFVSSAGLLDHFTIDINIKTWNIATSSYLALGNAAYYIYAKCEKGGANGSLFLTTAQIKVNQDANYYHFLVGVLHSAIDGVRGISLTFGQTTINGKFVTTGRIQSSDGQTYFDLDNNEIAGAIRFLPSGGGAYKTVASVDLAAIAAQNAANSANTAATAAQTAANNAATTAGTALNDAAVAAGIANGKGKVLTQSSQPTAADQNAATLWIDTTAGANTPKRWNGTIWQSVSDKVAIDAANNAVIASNAAVAAQLTANEAKGVTDNFTIVNGGLISSNTIKLGSYNQDVAGITGVGTASTSIRFWAGDSYANRNIAPFRVDQSGKVWMTNAVVAGEINATSGTIGGFAINANGFGLNGTGVEIYPNQGVKVKGWLTIPTAVSADSETAGRWQVYVDVNGSGGSGSNPPNVSAIGDLSDVLLASPVTGQALVYNGTKWVNQSVVTNLTNYFNKSEITNFFNGSSAMLGYNKANWDSAFSNSHAPDTLQTASNRSNTINGNSSYPLIVNRTSTGFIGIRYDSLNVYKWFHGLRELGDSDFHFYNSNIGQSHLILHLAGSSTFSGNVNAPTFTGNLIGTANNSTKWSSVDLDASTVVNGVVTSIPAFDGTNIVKPKSAIAIQAFLGLGSNAYQSKTNLSQYVNDLGNFTGSLLADTATYAGFANSDANYPYIRHSITNNVVRLLRYDQATALFQPIENQRLSTTSSVQFGAKLSLDNSYNSGVFNKQNLKLYLLNGSADEVYGFGVNGNAGIDYVAGAPSNGEHNFYAANMNMLKINGYGLSSIGRIAAAAGTNGGFENQTFSASSHNNIWRFRDSPEYGLAYYQGIGFAGGQDAIGFHFGNRNSPQFYVKGDGHLKANGGVFSNALFIPQKSGGTPTGSVWEIYVEA